jgi:hypothetical protein
VADSLNEAKAAFRAAWERGPWPTLHPTEAGQRLLSPEKADEKCST